MGEPTTYQFLFLLLFLILQPQQNHKGSWWWCQCATIVPKQFVAEEGQEVWNQIGDWKPAAACSAEAADELAENESKLAHREREREREREIERITKFEISDCNSQIILIQVTRFGSLLNCNIILLRKNEGDNIQSEVLCTF